MEPAICNAIILSDGVIREAGTGKLSLIGCFSTWNAPRFPFSVPPFCATAFLTNLRGKVDLHVTARVELRKTGHVLASISGRITLPPERAVNPEEIFEIPFPFHPFPIVEPGVYSLVVLADNEKLGERPFIVTAQSAVGMLPDKED